ncbi:MAG: ABC transporter ATP-binding protein [Chloroflexi bacterium]|uniref:ABC transporter ATP-binding protein n=1 Tax=Candidatus Flexifilum breve TaxID=3140694 RepID=UPI0031371680|nr:ABC transporter ATP-binding protein [Chloroflexota bacterium]
MLTLTNVSRQFGGLAALTNVNMTVPQGKITGLIGPNGAGKTTLINNISGLDHPTSGTIQFAAADISKAPPHRIAQIGIARTYQNIRLFGEMTALENLLISQHKRGTATAFEAMIFAPRYRREERRLRETAMHLLDRFNLTQVAHTRAGALPYGDQRRLEMARALGTDPKLILLDEPTAGMNPVETHELGEQILRLNADGITVLVIEHDMSLISQVCEGIYVLNFGQIIAHGLYAQLREDQRVIEAYLGEDDDGAA